MDLKNKNLKKPLKRMTILFISIVLIVLSSFLVCSGTTIGVNVLSSGEIYIEYGAYSPGVPVLINLTNFLPNENITIYINNSGGTPFTGYPILVLTDSNGDAQHVWDTTGASYDNYTIKAIDLSNTTYWDQEQVEILPPYNFTNSIVYNQTDEPENSTTQLIFNETVIAIDDEIFNFSLDYGREYTIRVVPGNISLISQLDIQFIANEGDFTGNSIGLYQTYNSTLGEILSVYPRFNTYTHYTITFTHSASSNQAIYKCSNWNFSQATCDGNWEKLQVIDETDTTTTVELEKGDPGFFIGDSCGDGTCDAGEDCSSCSADCGSCSTGGTTSGGVSGPMMICGDGICYPENLEKMYCPSDCEEKKEEKRENVTIIKPEEQKPFSPGVIKYAVDNTKAFVSYFRFLIALFGILLIAWLVLKFYKPRNIIFKRQQNLLEIYNKSLKNTKHVGIKIKKDSESIKKVKDIYIGENRIQLLKNVKIIDFIKRLIEKKSFYFKTMNSLLIYLNTEKMELLRTGEAIFVEFENDDFLNDALIEVSAEMKDEDEEEDSVEVMEKTIKRFSKVFKNDLMRSLDELKDSLKKASKIFERDYAKTSETIREKIDFFENFIDYAEEVEEEKLKKNKEHRNQ